MVKELIRTDEHISTTLDGEEIILHSSSEKYFGLNEVGTRLWESLEEPQTVDELVVTIHEEFDVSKKQSRKDVESFVADLEAVNLIEVSNGSGS
jgi:hypothetical protein